MHNRTKFLRVWLISVFCILFSKLVFKCFEKLFIKIIFNSFENKKFVWFLFYMWFIKNVFIYYFIIILHFAFKNRTNPLHQTLPPPQTHPFSTVTPLAIQPQRQIKLTENLTNILTAQHTHKKTHRQNTNHNPQPATHQPKTGDQLYQQIHNNPTHREPPHQQIHTI